MFFLLYIILGVNNGLLAGLNFSYPPLRQTAGILDSWSSFQGNNLFDELPMAQYLERSIYYTSNIKLVQLFLMFKVFFMKKT